MLFSRVETEREMEKLKKQIMKSPALLSRVLHIRKGLKYARRQGSLGGAMPTNAEILALYQGMVGRGEERRNERIELLLRKIKTKSNSGVAVVSVLTMPYKCPGRCTYCPTEENMPKSYLSKEPAAARALANDFDPRRQIFSRLQSLVTNGHLVDKIELIVIGGTWSFYHPTYQEWFIKECFRACNEFNTDTAPLTTASLVSLQKQNETAKCRIIGLSVETRPDYITSYEIKHLRDLGVTKVEIGVQHLDNAVLKLTKRDMKIEQAAKATEMLRNAGFKMVYHMMPNLPGSTPMRDIEMFSELFADGSPYHPDMMKMYPCMVLEKSELYDIWKNGGFRPYTDEEIMHVLREAKRNFPTHVRIIRVIRDIPATYIQAGSKISNMRQWLAADMKKNNWRCRCIRCREVRDMEVDPNDFVLTRTQYRTQTGKEFFLSFENKKSDKLAAFLRLRLPEVKPILPVLENAALIRELHTYGRLTRFGERGDQSQHVGFGRRLMQEAEKIAHEAGYEKIAVISGVGTREYYRKLGYELLETYMVKRL